MLRSTILTAAFITCSCQHLSGLQFRGEYVTPSLASLEQNLPAQTTMLIASLSNPVDLSAKALKSSTLAQAAQGNDALSAVLTPEGRVKSWGFDPAAVEGWQSTGIDPSAGFALGLLSKPTRLVITAKIDQPARFVSFLNARLGGGKTLFSIKGTPDGSKALYHNDYAFMRWDKVDDMTWLTVSNSPFDDPAYDYQKQSLQRQTQAAALSTSLEYQRLKPKGDGQIQLRFMPSAVPKDAQLAMQLKPGELMSYIQGISWSIIGEQSRTQLHLGNKGQTAVSRLFGADRAPAKASGRVLNDDHLSLRFRLNLATLLDGVLSLVPERLKEQAIKPIGMGQSLLMLTGNLSTLGWPGLTEAVNGDLILAYPKSHLVDAIKGPRKFPQGLVAILAGNQAESITKMLAGLGPILSQRFGAKPINVMGYEGFVMPAHKQPLPVPLYLVAVDDALVMALDQPSLERALALPAQKPSGPLANEKLIFGYHLPATLEANAKVSKPSNNPLAGLPMSFSGITSLVGSSIIDEQPAMMITSVVVLAMVAIPNFIKFQCRAKQSEAKSNLKAYFQAQKSYLSEYDEYQSLDMIGFDPEPGNRYTYCNTPTDCRSCERGPGSNTGFPRDMCNGVSLEQAKEACVKAGVMRTEGTMSEQRFVGCAVGRLQADGPLDVWTIDDSNSLLNLSNACR